MLRFRILPTVAVCQFRSFLAACRLSETPRGKWGDRTTQGRGSHLHESWTHRKARRRRRCLEPRKGRTTTAILQPVTRKSHRTTNPALLMLRRVSKVEQLGRKFSNASVYNCAVHKNDDVFAECEQESLAERAMLKLRVRLS